MTNIEDVVRQSLHDQVGRQPAMSEPATRALAGAAAVRRRRSVLAVCAVVLALVAVATGAAMLRDRGTGPVLPPATSGPTQSTTPSATTAPSTGPSLPTIGLSALINGHQLLLPDGKLVSLSQVGGDALRGYQTRDGWLLDVVSGETTYPDSLWLFQATGAGQRLIDHADSIAVAPDGRRFAWHSGGNLVVGHLDASGTVVTDATTAAPQRGTPIAFTGTAVLLGYSATGGGLDHLDVWVPQRGQYTPHWDQTGRIVGVFGATPDGSFIAQALAAPGTGSKNTCLARLDPMNALRVVATACGLWTGFEPSSMSPDGHWLAYLSPIAAGSTQAMLVDLSNVFQQPKTAGTWPTTTLGIWTGPDTMVVYGQDERIYQYRVGQPTGEQIAIAGMPPGNQPVIMPKLS